MPEADRYDIVVLGATGFTGGLVAAYLAERAAEELLRWAIAGRSRTKLEAVAADLVAGEPAAELTTPGIEVVDVGDALALENLAGRTRVLLTTVGPFDMHGEPVVAACVAGGCDYVDITGEPAFVARVIDRYHHPAQAQGLRVVSCCGFDSIPHDLGALLAVRALREASARGDEPLAELGDAIDLEGFVFGSGSVSGGTWHSAVRAMGNYRADQRQRRLRLRQQRLRHREGDRCPEAPRYGRRSVRYEPAIGAWAAPLPTIDPEVVLRSAALLPADYGPGFRYAHFVRVGSLPKLTAGALFIGGVFALAQLPPTRRLLLAAKRPGEGPDAATRAEGRFHVLLRGRCGGRTVSVSVRGGDPGYGETAKMVSEAALCLARERARTETAVPAPMTGVLTPAAALGLPLVARLRVAGIQFEVEA